MKIVCIGHSVYDVTLPVESFPEENKKLRVPERIECGGGPASNGAFLLAKWGMDTSIVSVVGNDYYGNIIKNDYINAGVNIDNLEIRAKRSTSSSYIIANKETGTRTIITYKEPQIRKLDKEVNIEADVILIDGEHPETAYEVLEKNPNAISVLDAGRLNDDTKFLGKFVTYFVCSKEYAEDFTDKDIDTNDIEGLISIHKSLEEYFNTNIVITLEDKGALAKIDGNYEIIPSIKVKAIDSTGAGDIFHGAFTYFIANNYSLRDTIRLANITGAISVTRVGSRNSIPMLSEVLDYDKTI